MRWRDRFLFAMEAVNRAQAATGEIKGHYLNVTAATMEDMYERADFARELGSDHRHDRPHRRLHRDARRCRTGPGANGVLLHLHRAGHGTYTRQKTHGVSASASSPSGAGCSASTTSTPAPWSASWRATPTMVRGYYDTSAAQRCIPRQSRPRASTSTRTGARCPASCRSPPAASTPGQMHQLLHYLGEDVVLQFGGGTIGHPMGIAAGATANRVAVEAMIKARNEGRDYFARGPGHPRRGGQALPASSHAALETWKDVTFDYESTDTPDVVAHPDAELGVRHADHPGHVLLPARPHRRARSGPSCSTPWTRAGRWRSSSPTTRTRATCYWEMWGLPHVRPHRRGRRAMRRRW